MKHLLLFIITLVTCLNLNAQGPTITSWIQNTDATMGRHYMSGSSTPINDNILANVQNVQYSTSWVYVSTTGVPSYITGPFLDGNPSLASDQSAIYQISLNPTPASNPPSTTGGNIGIFINGVSLFDYRDGVAWNPNTNALCGGPGNPPCPGGPQATQDWNRDAIPAEMGGFDCAKAHPAMGNYHHHQNPSAFNLDINVVSNICDLYPADGLYVIDANAHSPLIGYAYDGYPIYGAYAYKNADGTGGIARMKTSYQLSTATTRANGPAVGGTYINGYFREDYQYIANAADDYLDEHNGRFAITPEYPNGIYAYYATVDANHNSAYPYVVGPTFYGELSASKVTSITEPTTTYNYPTSVEELEISAGVKVYPNPSSDFIAIQIEGIAKQNIPLALYSLDGKNISESKIEKGSTLAFFETHQLYSGTYLVYIGSGQNRIVRKVILRK